jgi:hypothetical protein
MNKFIIKSHLLLFFLFSNTIWAESKFTGLYVGGNFGMGSSKYDIAHDTGDSDRINGEKLDGEYIDGWNSTRGVGIQIGYNQLIKENYIIGLELQYSKFDENKILKHEVSNPERDWFKANLDDSRGIKFKIGYLFNKENLIYTTLGYQKFNYDVVNYNDRHNPADRDHIIKTKNIDSNAMTFGLGYSTFINSLPNTAFFIEGNYSNNNSKKRFDENEMSNDTDLGDYSKIDEIFLINLGLNYYF